MNDDERPVATRWWALALVAVTLLCVVVAALGAPHGAEARAAALVGGILALYLVFFLTLTRRARTPSAAGLASIVVTVVVAAAITAVSPSAAIFQFWMYPLVWVLSARAWPALAASFLAALAVFGGFAVSTGGSPQWWVTAAVTQALSFAVSVVMGLWISAVYRYATERERLLEELTAAQDELAALHREAGTTAERERLSRELHDTIAQSLAATVMLVQRARREAEADGSAAGTLELAEEAASAALAETRALVAGSAPVGLGGGLADALRTLALRFARETEVDARLEGAEAVTLGREAEVALLRAAQEALSNVRKHAGASRVHLRLEREADAAVLRVRDDGRGFDPTIASDGFGLAGLRARLELVGGTLEVESAAGATELLARVPRSGSAS
jgi:signal transduction histidine kinase